MRFKDSGNRYAPYKTVFWPEHANYCKACQQVDIAKPATFVHVCGYPGSALLQEHLIKLQAPAEKAKAAKVLQWAKDAGTFKLQGAKQVVPTKYAGDE